MGLQILRSLVRFLQHPFFGPKISFKISRVESLSGHMLYSPCGPIGQGVWLRIRRLGVQVPPGIVFWGISSIGRVRALQARGTGIETLMLHFFFSEIYKKTKHLNTNSHIVPHFGLASIAWMAERSKALDSSSSIFGCVGSNPTPSIFVEKKRVWAGDFKASM